MKRRDFLRGALAAGAAALGGMPSAPLAGHGHAQEHAHRKDAPPEGGQAVGMPPGEAASRDPRKLILVQFGGGTRASESIDDPQHRWIPRLWNEMVPRGTLWTNVRVEGRVVHPNSTASILTGHREYDHLDWSRPPEHPTIFEIHRKARGAPDTDAWLFAYASILSAAGSSGAAGYGPAWGASVVEPPTIPRSTAEEMDRRMSRAAASGSPQAEVRAARDLARLVRETSRASRDRLRSPAAREFFDAQFEAWQSGTGTTSHDAFLTDGAIACMERFAPDVLVAAYGEIDCAHYGSWTRYVEAVRRTDELAWRLWRAAETLPAYRGRTRMLILPDHGRELERPGGWGFIHHSDFYTGEGADEGCRRVWMLALGPDVPAGRRVERPVPITAAAATGLEWLGLEPSAGAAPSALGARC